MGYARCALTGSRVLVTGASSGLGFAAALALARHAEVVVLVARRASRLAGTRRAISSRGGRALVYRTDLSRLSDVNKLRREVMRELGGVDVLINNAGTFWSGPSMVETSPSDWSYMLRTNLQAPYALTRAFAPGMIERGFGRVVNVISNSSQLAGLGCFRISKIGLEVLTSVVASELAGTGVATVAFNPGRFRSDQSLSGPHPRGAAAALVRLLHRTGEQINGSFFDVQRNGRRFRLRRRSRSPSAFGK